MSDSPPIKIYVNKKGNRIAFNLKRVYYLELLTPEIMKFLGSLKNKITKDGNYQNVSHLQINEVLRAHFNVFNNDYRHDLKTLYKFVPNKSFGELLDILPKKLIFVKIFNLSFHMLKCGLQMNISNR